MATATRIRNTADQAGRLRDNRGGLVIVLHYLIDTPNLIEAYQANGLPRKGDNYPVEPGEDPGPAALPCTDIDIRENTLYRGTTGEYTGTCWATVTFGGADASGTAVLRIPQSADEKWTEFEQSTTTVTVFGPASDLVGPTMPLNNGEGLQKTVGIARARIITHYARNSPGPNRQRLYKMLKEGPINSVPVTIPAEYGMFAPIEMGIGQVKYVTFSTQRVGEFLQVEHTVMLNFDHLDSWAILDVNGIPQSGVQSTRLYVLDNFEGLWD